MICILFMKKKVIYDMMMNIVATAIPLIVLQLLVLPQMAEKMTDAQYGLLVTVVAFMNVIPSTFGNTLNNIRLLFQNKYDEKNKVGDFQIILLVSLLICAVITIGFSIKYKTDFNFTGYLLSLILALLWLVREYYIVAYRLIINYTFIMLNNVVMVLGYLVGYYVFLRVGYWQIVYLAGLIVSILFVLFTSDIWKEPVRKTEFLAAVTSQSVMLLIAGLLARVTVYADKLLLYPLLGGGVVAIYFAATVFGKIVSTAIAPISSVALTYLSKMNKKSDNIFNQSMLISAVFCVFGYIVCILISRPVLTYLYPQFVDEAMKYIYVTTATTVIYTMISILNPFIMKFCNMKWQIVISAVTAIVYMALCLILLHYYGLMGFCLGALLTNIVKLLVMFIIYFKMSDGDSDKLTEVSA